MTVLTAMSGGVDSSAAAALLMEQGFETAGATLLLLDAGAQAVSLAQASARAMGIEHHVFDCREEFKNLVISPFCQSYFDGKTPNPCALCNRLVKFGLFLDRAAALGFDKMATGHYARVEESGGRFLLKKAACPEKDQTYFLYRLTQAQLSRALFPLGDMTKAEVRDFAEKRSLPSAKAADSQDVCFIPDGDYADFIEKFTGKISPRGSFVDENGAVLGAHMGAVRYTVGQRRGLGVALCKPMYVKSKDVSQNTVTLSDNAALFEKSLEAEEINFIPFDSLSTPLRVCAKIRYRHEAAPAVVEQISPDRLHVEFDAPQRAIAPGQAVVFYDGDIIVGGGKIC